MAPARQRAERGHAQRGRLTGPHEGASAGDGQRWKQAEGMGRQEERATAEAGQPGQKEREKGKFVFLFQFFSKAISKFILNANSIQLGI